MFVMPFKIRQFFFDTGFISAFTALLIILFIQVTRCLDLTDEMQYYGEIKGLLETGSLFSNDLFIQQSVYILLHPLFSLYHVFFGFDGLVFFGRLIMAVISIVLFLYAYKKCLDFEFSSTVASLTALSLTLAIPYHGIFAPSYNTISQVIWILFTLSFYEWKNRDSSFWGVMPILMAFAHPTSSIMMSLLVLMRLLKEREFIAIKKFFLVIIAGTLVVIPVLLYFAKPQDYLASFVFSSGYGVGTAFFSHRSEPLALLMICVMFGVCTLYGHHIHRDIFALLFALSIVVATALLLPGYTWGAYSIKVVCILSIICALGYCWALYNQMLYDKTKIHLTYWLMLELIIFAATLGITSSNGIGQATGSFMIGLPLLIAIAVGSDPIINNIKSFSCIHAVSVGLVLILFVTHWSRYPYRDVYWWQTKEIIQSVPEFKFIYTSQDRASFIRRIQTELKSVTQGKRTLIISEYPGLYFVLGAYYETCMLYMHSLTSDKSEKALLRCLSNKNPEIVLDVSTNDDLSKENSRLKYTMRNYFYQQGLNCTTEWMEFYPKTKNNPNLLKYSIYLSTQHK